MPRSFHVDAGRIQAGSAPGKIEVEGIGSSTRSGVKARLVRERVLQPRGGEYHAQSSSRTVGVGAPTEIGEAR
jgi:hypothetical protein